MKINYNLSNRANKSDLQQKWEFGFSLLVLMFCRVKSNIQKLLRNTAIYFRNCTHSFCLHWKMPHLSNFPYSLCYCAWLFFQNAVTSAEFMVTSVWFTVRCFQWTDIEEHPMLPAEEWAHYQWAETVLLI